MTAKNNVKANIRTVCLEDATAVLDLQREIVSEGEFFISVIEEYNKTLEQHQDWIRKIIENEREAILVAEMDSKVVGLIVFSSQNLKRLSHTGSITMMIGKEHRNLGIGKLLLNELLTWAQQNPLIEKVSLGVFSTNQRAIALYKNMGFVEEGRKIKEFKLNDNEYIDDILMYKFV
ncbi:GNAT family N-acetyltransferase [Cytobacillus dafuensis]|uniref:GNAT family N-acetyltransferase n=1 Tax=Cytobacillus dafuensis TaxID=1742359 RepID=A0A5B8YZX2_CYTDA|nr:GNAT family protein [Cytobacillus dafuensis]QED46282.1 GNAT family N-acetyltransferase [Cytobacillus dafuensis]